MVIDTGLMQRYHCEAAMCSVTENLERRGSFDHVRNTSMLTERIVRCDDILGRRAVSDALSLGRVLAASRSQATSSVEGIFPSMEPIDVYLAASHTERLEHLRQWIARMLSCDGLHDRLRKYGEPSKDLADPRRTSAAD